jgi:hypothetical protein
MSAVLRYYLAENGEAVGPFTVEQLRSMFASGRVHAGSQVCREGMSEWVTADGLGLHKTNQRVLRVEPSRATILLVVAVVLGLFLFFGFLKLSAGVKEATENTREATRLMKQF